MKFLKLTLWGIAGLLLAAVATVLLVNATLPGREKKLNEAWGKTLISLDELAKQYPKVEDNASARAVEKLAAPLGICMAPGGGECKREKPADADKKAFDAVATPGGKSQGLSDYINAQLEKSSGGIGAPPEALQQFLAGRESALAALRDQLLKNDPPRWGYDPGRGMSMEIPNLLGQMSLTRVLLAHALIALKDGQDAQALDDLNAAWQLREGLTGSPALICRLIILAVERMELGVLRRFAAPPAGWEDRLRRLDSRKEMALAIETEAWMMQRTVATLDSKSLKEGVISDGGAPRGGWIPEFLQRPYLRLSVDESSEAIRMSVERYRLMDPCEVAAHATDEAETLAGLSWWNVVGKIAVPNYRSIWSRAGRNALELEMTRKLLEVKHARASSANGAWPVNPEAIGESSCKAGKWDYQVAADGSMTLAFSPKIDWGKTVKGADIPLSVTEAAPAHP